MKINPILIFFFLLTGCNIVEDIKEVEDTPMIDPAVLTGKCCIAGKLHKTIMYYGSTKNSPNAVTEFYYDEQDRQFEFLNIANASPIVGIRLTRREYNDRGLLQWTRRYDIGDDQNATPSIFTEYLYDSLDRLYSHITHYPQQGNSQQSVYRYYDEDGNLIIVGGPNRDEGERMFYEYEGGKIKYRIRSLGGDDVYAGYLYVYNDEGQLVAQEFFRHVRINNPGEGEGVFKEYDYDLLGRLSEEREYDPYWGFTMRHILEYIYWDGEVN